MSNEYKDWYNDLSENQKEIYKICMKYPFLIPRDIEGKRDEDFDYSYLGLEIPDGWNKLFYQMCSDIKPILEKEGLLDDFYFIQVKEKFNMLRCYYSNAPEEVRKIVAKYELMAPYICTECGKPAVYETQGYYASYCENCLNNLASHPEVEKIEPKTYYKFRGYSNGEHYEKTISFEDEWNRYLKEN